MEREEGYYWVRNGKKWHISYWYINEFNHEFNAWLNPGSEIDYYDDDYDEIDEKKIVRDTGGYHDVEEFYKEDEE